MNQREACDRLKLLIAQEDGLRSLLDEAEGLVSPRHGEDNHTYHPDHSANVLNGACHELRRELQQHLKAGGKITDSPLVDYVVASFARTSGVLTADGPWLYQVVWAATELDYRVSQNQGELIALVEQRFRENKWWGGGTVVERIIRMGRITGATCGERSLPTDSHYAFRSLGWDNGEYFALQEGDIWLAPPSDDVGEMPLKGLNVLLDVSKIDSDFKPDPERPIYRREILIGEEEITEWFDLRGRHEVLIGFNSRLEVQADEQVAA